MKNKETKRMRKGLHTLLAFLLVFSMLPLSAFSASKIDSGEVIPDKAYTMKYQINENGTDKPSIANQYFTKKATILVKDNEKYAHVEILNGDMVRELETDSGKAIIVEENNEDNDNKLVAQFKVDSLEMDLKMRVIVPAMPGFPGYDQVHTTQIVFDEDSNEELDDIANLKLIASDGDNGPDFEKNVDPVEPEGEELDYSVDVSMMERYIER